MLPYLIGVFILVVGRILALCCARYLHITFGAPDEVEHLCPT